MFDASDPVGRAKVGKLRKAVSKNINPLRELGMRGMSPSLEEKIELLEGGHFGDLSKRGMESAKCGLLF